jgi:hypothetical protein
MRGGDERNGTACEHYADDFADVTADAGFGEVEPQAEGVLQPVVLPKVSVVFSGTVVELRLGEELRRGCDDHAFRSAKLEILLDQNIQHGRGFGP